MAEKKKEEKEKKEGEETEVPVKKSKKKLFIIIAAVLVLVLGGAVGFVAFGKKKVNPEDAEKENAEPEHHYETVTLDPIIVNLSENASFLKIKMTLEYDPKVVLRANAGKGGGGGYGGGGAGEGEKATGLPGILGEREPQIRDAIIRIMSSKKAEEVLTKDGKETLKQELIEAINESTGLDEPAITNIYFAEFVVQ